SMPNAPSSGSLPRLLSLRRGPCGSAIKTGHVILRKNRVDVMPPTFDEPVELLVTDVVAAASRHRDAEGLREEPSIHLRPDRHNVERNGLTGSEVARHRAPGGGDVDVAARHRRDDCRRRTVRPVVAVD